MKFRVYICTVHNGTKIAEPVTGVGHGTAK